MSGASAHGLPLEEERRVYYEGIRLFNEGQYFEAHDTWEEIWRAVQDRRRERFYRGLIQGAVTLELLRRGRAVGVRQVFVSCSELLAGIPPVFMGLDIGEFMAKLRYAIEPALEDLENRSVRIDAGRLFAISPAYDPFEESRHDEISATERSS